MSKVFRTQYKVFPIVVEPAENGYFAYTDILQGAHAEGRTIGEAIDNLQDVIEKHLEVREEHGENIPSLGGIDLALELFLAFAMLHP